MKVLILFLFVAAVTNAKELYPEQTMFNNQQYQQASLLVRYNNWQDEQKFNELVGEYRNYPTQRQKLEFQEQLQRAYQLQQFNNYKQQQEIDLYNQIHPRVIYYNDYNYYHEQNYYRRKPEPRYYY